MHVSLCRPSQLAANETELVDVVVAWKEGLTLQQLGKDTAHGLEGGREGGTDGGRGE
jgi:hypothetical protein